MSQQSKIEWTGATINPIRARDIGKVGISQATGKVGWFCEKISPGCANCYASKMNIWRGNGLEFLPENSDQIELFLDEKTLESVLHWKKPRKIFWCDMTDMFQDAVKDEWLDEIFLVMARTPQHVHQVLTKRPERMRRYVEGFETAVRLAKKIGERGIVIKAAGWPPPNIWLGVSVENQHFADERIPLLLQTPAAVRFISAEPLLGAVDLRKLPHVHALSGEGDYFDALDGRTYFSDGKLSGGFCSGGLNWVIVGGESGPGARPMHPDWARSLRDQCVAAGVKFFFKQWGNWGPHTYPGDDFAEKARGAVNWKEWPDGTWAHEWGKKLAGRLLDGREWNEFPQ